MNVQARGNRARVPHVVPANDHDRAYLEAKGAPLRHLLEIPDGPEDEAA
jgi:hypothetical protein